MKFVNAELAKLSDWFRANKLSLNVNKTNYIIFRNRSRNCFDSNFHIVIDDKNIERVSYTKFLGVFVDEDLNWKHHASEIALKISRNIGVLNRVKHILPFDSLLTLYYTLIHPHFLYCNIVWGGASQTALNRLVCLQKRALRVISRSEYRAPSSPLFKRFGILKLPDIHKFQIYMFMHKYKYDLLPVSCSTLVRLKVDAACYDFRRENEFVTFNFFTEIRKKSISVIGPDLWNNLHDSIKNVSSISGFKSLLLGSFIESY